MKQIIMYFRNSILKLFKMPMTKESLARDIENMQIKCQDLYKTLNEIKKSGLTSNAVDILMLTISTFEQSLETLKEDKLKHLDSF